ncbi:MAG: DUF222 domain-containing protein, partial [Mycobacteriales bacterium]
RVSLEHAAAMSAATGDLDLESARWVEATVLADTRARTPGQLAHRARQAALQVGADRERRRAAAQAERELVAFEFGGQVSFSWTMPSLDAAVVAAWLDGTSGRRGADDQRPAAQRRADALYELVAGTLERGGPTESDGGAPDAGEGRPNLPHLDVLATHESLLDHLWREAGNPTAEHAGGRWAGAHIDGRSVFGAQLRQLGCDADLRLTLINDRGCILDQHRTTRVVSARLRGLLAVRDQHCRFPGCQTPARRCHAHHIWHWADGGPTNLQNLLLICDRHHHALHDGGWTVDLHADGTTVWTSPTGQSAATPAELNTLALPPPPPDTGENNHPDRHWIRPDHEFFFRPPPDPGPEPPPLAATGTPGSGPTHDPPF